VEGAVAAGDLRLSDEDLRLIEAPQERAVGA
jgi:hypothetical protein